MSEEGAATYCSILAWRIPRTAEPGGLQTIGSQRVGHDWSDLAHMHTHTIKWLIMVMCLDIVEDNYLWLPTQIILPLKTFMVEQNLWSWFLDMSSPSFQVAGLLNKATLSFPTNTCLEYWLSNSKDAEPEFGNTLCSLHFM